ncbi:hypothetical protein [Nonomuraea sp. JJY05]|uniref:hypothetical protein n=1 Tax=Nonomuraea sp. JJY05 TaxID=3350255 RepID=UPI00373F1585
MSRIPVMIFSGAEDTSRLADLHVSTALDPALRHGPEVDDPARGLYEVEHLPLVKAEITTRRLVPEAVPDYPAEHIAALPRLIQR